jgi:hypothetical protein
VDSLTVYAFDYSAAHIDDTGGYTFLLDVPERYHAISDGPGMLWIVPACVVVVKSKGEGVSHFGDVKTGQCVADLYRD